MRATRVGFAIKFYTDEGSYDAVGNNTPVFFRRDPIKFTNFVHSQKKSAQQPAVAESPMPTLGAARAAPLQPGRLLAGRSRSRA